MSSLPDPFAAITHRALRHLHAGSLTLVAPDGTAARFEGPLPGADALVHVHKASAYRRLVLGGSLGVAEGYLAGDWDTPDLDAVLTVGVASIAGDVDAGSSPLAGLIARFQHRMNDNHERGSRRNIAAHYDLGNEFYSLWLDETMTYSAAIGPVDDASLAEAQRRKWDRMLEMLQPSRGDHLLEIGCGWGGFAMHAAREAGCRVTAVTISEEQFAHARAQVESHGLDGLVQVRMQDYRRLDGAFDGIASIEMFEAVGERWWPVFFSRVRELLAPGRPAAIQTITIGEERFEDYRRHPDFIQRYIFPGGMLPTPTRFARECAAAGLRIEDEHRFGDDYAQTLASWAARFENAADSVRAMGFDERFIRMWRYYLAYCRAGFRAGTIDVMQVRLR